MTKEDLNRVLELHRRWITLEIGGVRANLRGADLCGADLYGADLRGADLRRADLYGADLRRANLRGADLCGADLRVANLYGADLYGANLYGANLCGANLYGAQNIPTYIPMACPSDGEFIGWKKVKDEYLVKLKIPANAKRSSATTSKCRCDKAMVLEITKIKSGKPVDAIVNNKYASTTYTVGEMVYPDSFDDDRWNECSNGIHFFINKEEAINYI